MVRGFLKIPFRMSDGFIPKRLGEYRELEYWEARYQQDKGTYDWLLKYENVKPLLLPHLTSSSLQILNLGCGNSSMSEQLWDDGFHHITNIDYSSEVIRRMSERVGQRDGMCWLTMDMRKMDQLNDSSFDLVIDKGSLDAVWTDGGSVWTPSQSVLHDVDLTVSEIIRLLKPGAKFISISFGQPHFRLPHLQREAWTCEVKPIEDSFYFYYVFTKL